MTTTLTAVNVEKTGSGTPTSDLVHTHPQGVGVAAVVVTAESHLTVVIGAKNPKTKKPVVMTVGIDHIAESTNANLSHPAAAVETTNQMTGPDPYPRPTSPDGRVTAAAAKSETRISAESARRIGTETANMATGGNRATVHIATETMNGTVIATGTERRTEAGNATVTVTGIGIEIVSEIATATGIGIETVATGIAKGTKTETATERIAATGTGTAGTAIRSIATVAANPTTPLPPVRISKTRKPTPPPRPGLVAAAAWRSREPVPSPTPEKAARADGDHPPPAARRH